MRKALILPALLALGLAACGEPSYKPLNQVALPPELADCKVFQVSDGFHDINVVRCPNSDTSAMYKQGKQTKHSVTLSRDDPASAPASSVVTPVPVVQANAPEVIEYKGHIYHRGVSVAQ